DNQYLDNLREIEIDDSGNLYVTNTDSLNESDKLWIYDTETGAVKRRLCLAKADSDTYIPAPIAMHLSSRSMLYLASAVQESDADSVSIHVLSASSLSFIRKVTINNMGHVTAMTEDSSTGRIWVAGFTMTDIPEYINPLAEPFYQPYIAQIPLGAGGPVDAEPISDPESDLALPLSIISIASTGVDCSVANIDGVGHVDFFDFVFLAAHWLETACGDCGGADLTGEGNVDTKDMQLLSYCWLNSSP
ncbi:MAG: YncE family protein, partial [Planctomycetota bacterium]